MRKRTITINLTEDEIIVIMASLACANKTCDDDMLRKKTHNAYKHFERELIWKD